MKYSELKDRQVFTYHGLYLIKINEVLYLDVRTGEIQETQTGYKWIDCQPSSISYRDALHYEQFAVDSEYNNLPFGASFVIKHGGTPYRKVNQIFAVDLNKMEMVAFGYHDPVMMARLKPMSVLKDVI